MAIRVLAICSANTLTKDILRMIKGRKIRMIDYNIKLKSHFLSKEVRIPQQLSLTTSQFMTTKNPTNQRTKIILSEGNRQAIGSTTIPTKKDTMGLSLLSLSISKKARKPKRIKRMNLFGCNDLFYCSPNFNGTSKNIAETLSRPCPAPSQLHLNQVRNVIA